MLQSPLSTFVDGMALGRWVFERPAEDDPAAVAALVEWARVARANGFLALENRIDDFRDAFASQGLRMLVDGFDADRMHDALTADINAWEDRNLAAARVWEAAGGYAPTIGIIGAVLGLIHVMENLTDPTLLGSGIAVAFVATIYGVAFANLLFLPVAAKLRALVAAEVAYRDLLLDGLTGIATGENPRVIEARLVARAA
jgi:chemotaxis protein MotA